VLFKGGYGGVSNACSMGQCIARALQSSFRQHGSVRPILDGTSKNIIAIVRFLRRPSIVVSRIATRQDLHT